MPMVQGIVDSIRGLHNYCRAFKRSRGVPPHRWLPERRFERISALLVGKRV